MSSSTMGMMMVMMAGVVICCSGGASSFVALINEKIIEIDAFDFLLIPGWGKDKATETTTAAPGTGTGTGTGTETGVEHCIDTMRTECAGITGSERTACASKSKAACIARGGTWTSSVDTYPTDCITGARDACKDKTGSSRQYCIDSYKKKCVAAGGTWGDQTSSPSYPPGPPPPGEWREGCYYLCKSPVDPKWDDQYRSKPGDQTKCVRRTASGQGGHVAAGPWEINATMICP